MKELIIIIIMVFYNIIIFKSHINKKLRTLKQVLVKSEE